MGAIHQALLSIPVPSGLIIEPADVASMWEFWEPRLEGLNDNDPIGQLTGQIAPGSGHNFTQSNSSKKPVYKANIVNGQGVARFDGSDDEMVGANPSGLSAVHFFVVIKIDADPPAANKNGTWSFSSGCLGLYPNLADTTKISACDFLNAGAQVFSKGGMALDTWRVYEVASTATAWKFRLDGTLLHTVGGIVGHQTNGFNPIGRSGPFDPNFLDGDIAGIYISSAELSNGDRIGLYNYFNNEFGTTAT